MSSKFTNAIGVRVTRGEIEVTETIDDGYLPPETDALKALTPLEARQLAAQLLAAANEVEARP